MSRSSRAGRSVLAAMVLVLSLTACGTPAETELGHLQGAVYLRGGMNAERRPAAAKVTARPTDRESDQTYTTDAASDGTFTLDLPQGTYAVEGQLKQGGLIITPKLVTISAGETTEVEVFSTHP